MKNEDRESDVEGMDGPALAVSKEPGAVLANAPWWMISAGIHIVLLLGATLVIVDKMMQVEEPGIIISQIHQDRGIVLPDTRKEDEFERRGLDMDTEKDSASNDPIIFNPMAEDSDHNESNEGIDGNTMKGDSPEFLSYTPGDSKGLGRQLGKSEGAYSTMGVGPGGGGGGRFGNGPGGRRDLRNVGIGKRKGTQTDEAIINALKWLARHQNADGSWSADRYSVRCTAGTCSGNGSTDYDSGLTALSLLAFLGAGFTHLSHDEIPDPVNAGKVLKFGEVVKSSLRWFVAHQGADGSIGMGCHQEMYNHSIAALALSEAYGMTQASFLRDPAQKAIDFLVAAQNPGKGWRYSPRCGGNDTSVTGWCIMALKSAELSDLGFPTASYAGAIAWLNDATGPAESYYRVGYASNAPGHVHNQWNKEYQDHPSMSAVAIMSRIFIQKDRHEKTLGSVQAVMQDLPEWKDLAIDYYYWYYGSLALFQLNGPDGSMWKKWSGAVEKALVPNQGKDTARCNHGSWAPEPERWKNEGGRVYATAINALTLETVYRYDRVFGGSSAKKEEPK